MIQWIRSLSPYQTLLLLVLPAAIIEPLKLAAVFIAGDGHWFTGIIVEVVAYAASILLIHKLFQIVKPKLMELPWFARMWGWLSNFCRQVFGVN